MAGWGPIADLPFADVPASFGSAPAVLNTLPQASGGLHYLYWLTAAATVTDGGATDLIYDGSSSGSQLSGSANSFIELISPLKGLWFVKRKTGTWTLQ